MAPTAVNCAVAAAEHETAGRQQRQTGFGCDQRAASAAPAEAHPIVSLAILA